MHKEVTLESLKADRKVLMEELQLVEALLAFYERQKNSDRGKKKNSQEVNRLPKPISARHEILNTVYNLVRHLGRAATIKEIFEKVEELGILKGKKNKQATLAAILDQLTKKDNPKLFRVARGVYDIIK